MSAGISIIDRRGRLLTAFVVLLVLYAASVAVHTGDRGAYVLRTVGSCAAITAVGLLAGFACVAWWRRREVMRILRGRVIFVYSSRGGWKELICNNVLCLLDPQRVYVLDKWRAKEAQRPVFERVVHELRRMPVRPSAPFLMSIPPRGSATLTPLHHRMRPFMNCRKRNELTQQRLRELLTDAMQAYVASGP